MIFLKFITFLLLKRRQTSLSNSKIVKEELIIRFHCEIKIIAIDPVFSNWVNFNKKVFIINGSANSKSFKAN